MRNAMAFTFNKGIEAANTGCRLLAFKSEISDAVIKKSKEARKALLGARYAAQECVDTTTLAIRKNPVKAVCSTFGAAFTIGVIAGWLVKKSSN